MFRKKPASDLYLKQGELRIRLAAAPTPNELVTRLKGADDVVEDMIDRVGNFSASYSLQSKPSVSVEEYRKETKRQFLKDIQGRSPKIAEKEVRAAAIKKLEKEDPRRKSPKAYAKFMKKTGISKISEEQQQEIDKVRADFKKMIDSPEFEAQINKDFEEHKEAQKALSEYKAEQFIRAHMSNPETREAIEKAYRQDILNGKITEIYLKAEPDKIAARDEFAKERSQAETNFEQSKFGIEKEAKDKKELICKANGEAKDAILEEVTGEPTAKQQSSLDKIDKNNKVAEAQIDTEAKAKIAAAEKNLKTSLGNISKREAAKIEEIVREKVDANVRGLTEKDENEDLDHSQARGVAEHQVFKCSGNSNKVEESAKLNSKQIEAATKNLEGINVYYTETIQKLPPQRLEGSLPSKDILDNPAEYPKSIAEKPVVKDMTSTNVDDVNKTPGMGMNG